VGPALALQYKIEKNNNDTDNDASGTLSALQYLLSGCDAHPQGRSARHHGICAEDERGRVPHEPGGNQHARDAKRPNGSY